MQLNSTDLELIRSQPQYSELFLSIFKPTVALACSPSGTLTAGQMAIPVYNITTGSFTAVEPDMTLMVGTSAGSDDLGRIRVKAAGGGYINVAENSDIDWSAATNLTVLKYWEVWPIYPRIIQDPSNAENVIFYKDYDILYSGQNSTLGVFPQAGSHRAGFVGDSFYWSASGTEHLITGTALSYSWVFEGGTPTGSTLQTPGNVTYNTPGDYVTRLIVTGANGTTDKAYRYVSIKNRVGTSNQHLPIRKWEMDSLSGSRGEGGYSTTIRIIDEIITDLRGGDVIVIWSDNSYGSNHRSFGTDHNNPTIFFTGHVVNGSIKYNYKTSTTEFEVASITQTMKEAEGFAISVESKATPSTWFELYDMDSKRAIYHYLKWHSTALKLADFEFVGDDKPIQFFDSDRESIYDAVDNYMRNTLVGNLVADRNGKLWAEVSAWAYDDPTGTFVPIQTVSKRDWISQPVIEVRNVRPLSYLEMGGVAYSGPEIGTYSPLLGCAPGQAPGARGSVERSQGLALSSQNQLNLLLGNLYANKNYRYPKINMDMSGNYSNLDIAPQEALKMVINPEDTNSRISIDGLYTPDSIQWGYNSVKKSLLPSIDYLAIVNGKKGETITIPPVIDSGGYDYSPPSAWDAGAFSFAFPTSPNLNSTPDNGQPSTVIIWSSNWGILYTLDFDAVHPTWYFMNDGIATLEKNFVSKIVVSPNGTLMCHIYDIFSGKTQIYTAPALGETWTLLVDETMLGKYISAIGVNPDSDLFYFAAGDAPNGAFYEATINSYSVRQTGLGLASNSVGSIFVSQNQIVHFCQLGGGPFPPTAVIVYTMSGVFMNYYTLYAFTPFLSGVTQAISDDRLTFYYWDTFTPGDLAFGKTVGIIRAQMQYTISAGFPNITAYYGLASAPSGKRAMGAAGESFNCVYTSDSGASWANSGVITLGNDVWENCKDENRWIFGGGVNMNLTMDFGLTYHNKQGNMIQMTPLIDITGIRYIA